MRTTRVHALLLTGVPGIGKTTVIRKVAEYLVGQRLAGFYTEEMRVSGQRLGFRLITFDGESAVMAHVDFSKTWRVGKYGVDVSTIDAMARRALSPDPSVAVFLVDEIGKMECYSTCFVSCLQSLLAGYTPIVATVAQRGRGLIAEVKHRDDCLLWEVTMANRDELPQRVLSWLELRSNEQDQS